MEAFSFLNTLNELPGVRAAWVARVPHLEITGDRDEAMAQLRPWHERAVRDFAGESAEWWRAEQVHGNSVAAVPGASSVIASDGLPVVPGVDGLVTCSPGVCLAIYVADCGPIWLADRRTGAIGLLHSGKQGTQQNILDAGLRTMRQTYGSQPSDIVAVLGPCIRPPDYEIDFAATISRQARDAGIAIYHDCGINTAADLHHHYSYRRELGKTGRMMALIIRQ